VTQIPYGNNGSDLNLAEGLRLFHGRNNNPGQRLAGMSRFPVVWFIRSLLASMYCPVGFSCGVDAIPLSFCFIGILVFVLVVLLLLEMRTSYLCVSG